MKILFNLTAGICTFGFLCLTSNAVFAGSTQKIAVLQFNSSKSIKQYAEITRDLLEIQLYKKGNYQILERNQIDALFREQEFKASGCIDTTCAIRIGKMLTADMVVIGNIRKARHYIITAKLVDVEKGILITGDYVTAKSEHKFESAVKKLADKMINNITLARKEQQTNISMFLYLSTVSHYSSDQRLKNWDFGLHDKAVTFGFYRHGAFSQGFQTGILYCKTEIDFHSSKSTYNSYWLFPVLISFGYNFDFNITANTCFRIFPTISAGASYLYLRQTYEDSHDERHENLISILVKPGIMWGFSFGDSISLMMGIDYSTNFNIDQDLRFLLITIGGEYKF